MAKITAYRCDLCKKAFEDKKELKNATVDGHRLDLCEKCSTEILVKAGMTITAVAENQEGK